MTNKRERIISLIRNLREKTVDRGCTEEEALAAAEKVSSLMADYQLSLTDISEVKDDVYGAMSRVVAGGSERRRTWHETKSIWGRLAAFCDVELWTEDDKLVFFGAKQDCEVAHYMVDLLKNTADAEWQAYRKRGTHTDRTARASFMIGFSRRVRDRLDILKKMRENRTSENEQSRALVVVKGQVVTAKYNQYLAEKGLKMRQVKVKRSVGDRAAYGAGQQAGDRAHLGSGITKSGHGGHIR